MDINLNKTFHGITKMTQILCLISFMCGFCAVISFNTSPILSSVRGWKNKSVHLLHYVILIYFPDHPFPFYIPFADYRESPWYEIIYFFQTWLNTTGYIAYCSTGNIFLSTISFGIIRIRVLQYNLRNLSSVPGQETEKLRQCFEDHVMTIKYIFVIFTTIF